MKAFIFALVALGAAPAIAADLTVTGNVWFGDSEPTLPICTTAEPCAPLTYLGPFGPTSTPPPTIPVDFLVDGNGQQVSITDDEIVITQTSAPTYRVSIIDFSITKY